MSLARIADWAVSLRAETLPDAVRRAAARERASVRGAIAAAWTTEAGRRWGRATAPGHERDAGLSVLLDYDDYGFLGHPGHSAAVVAGGHEEAHVAAAELALRLGAACLLAPAGPQASTFAHAPAAALAAGVRAGFDARALERALGLALLAVDRPPASALVATLARAARVAEPVAAGLRAAALAGEGVEPPPRALRDGLAAAALAPLPALLDGLGETWLLPTLSFKPRPASATLQAVLAALANLGVFETGRVVAVDVAAGAATLLVDSLARGASEAEPIATAFSVARAVRTVLEYGDLTPATLERPLPPGPPVRLRHEPAFTRDTVASLERGAPLSRAALRGLGALDWVAVLVGGLRSYGRAVRIPTAALAALRPRNAEWSPDELELVFPARVVVRLAGGRDLVAERRLHPGQPGQPQASVDAVIAAKVGAYTQAA